jgi:hypothetical protein
MKRARILKPDKGVLLEFDLPSNLSDVPLSRFIDFLVDSRLLSNSDEGAAIVAMTKAVSSFYAIDFTVLTKAAAGVGANTDSYEGSVRQLYAYAVKMISEFKPTTASSAGQFFTYKGEQYFIPAIVEQAIKGEYILPDLSVGEVIEVAEMARFREQTMMARADPNGSLKVKFDKMVSERIGKVKQTDAELKAIEATGSEMYREKVETDGDPDGSLMFTYYLKMLAALTRKEGESLPFEDSTREHWLQSRAAHFQGIDAATALNVDFFLTSTLASSRNALRVGGFLRNLSFAVVVEMLLRSAKHMNVHPRTANKYSKRSAGGK